MLLNLKKKQLNFQKHFNIRITIRIFISDFNPITIVPIWLYTYIQNSQNSELGNKIVTTIIL